jgi:hypothetical protein
MSVEADDPNSTSDVALEEGRNFWWFSVADFSAAHFAHVDREKAASVAKAAAEEARFTEHDREYTAASATPVQLKTNAFRLLWDVSATTRNGKPGVQHSCMYEGCLQTYFVGKGSSQPHRQLFSNIITP